MTEESAHPQRFVRREGRRSRLVLDSTELASDWLLCGLAFRVLRHLREVHMLQVSVPATVITETRANHSRVAQDLHTRFDRIRRECERLGLTPPLWETSIDEEPYSDRLEHGLELLDAEILPTPLVQHDDVVDRAVNRTPPFNASGGGYRDTLVWLTALANVSEGDALYIASRDSTFKGADGQLAAPLMEEAHKLGVEAHLVTDLQRWVVEQLPWATDLSLPEVAAEVRDERIDLYLAQSDFPWDLEFTPYEVGLPSSAVDPSVVHLREVTDFRRLGVKDVGPGETLVEYDVSLDMIVEAHISWSDADTAGFIYEVTRIPDRVVVRASVEVGVTLGGFFDAYDAGVGVSYLRVVPKRPAQPATGEDAYAG